MPSFLITIIEHLTLRKKGYIALAAIICGLVFGSLTTKHALIAAEPEQELPVAAAELTVPVLLNQSISTIPLRISIPTQGVNAAIDPVGISIHHTIAVPPNYADVGWYRYGPTPGSMGTAIIDGHLDNGFGLAAVFKNLSHLKKGEKVFIENASNQKLEFEVTDIQRLAEASSIGDFFSPSVEPRLVLITCEGQWIPEKKMYSDRLVIITEYRGIVSP